MLETKKREELASKIKEASTLEIEGDQSIKITHKEISTDLATSREVVTRILKKLENDKKIIIKNIFWIKI